MPAIEPLFQPQSITMVLRSAPGFSVSIIRQGKNFGITWEPVVGPDRPALKKPLSAVPQQNPLSSASMWKVIQTELQKLSGAPRLEASWKKPSRPSLATWPTSLPQTGIFTRFGRTEKEFGFLMEINRHCEDAVALPPFTELVGLEHPLLCRHAF